MEKIQIENMVNEIITFLKKWDLWESVEIYCDGKRYLPYSNSNYDYIDMNDYQKVFDTSPEQLPLLYIWCEGTRLSSLLAYGVYEVRLSKLSDAERKYIIKAEKLDELHRLYYEDHSILEETDFDSYEEYFELERELEEQEIIEELCFFEPYNCGEAVVEKIRREFYAIIEKPGTVHRELGHCAGFGFFAKENIIM